jgi:hypothetical protein
VRLLLQELLQVSEGTAGAALEKSLPPSRRLSHHVGEVESMNPDPQLSALLQDWAHTSETPNSFRREVWSRIEARRPRFLENLISLLAHPRIAAATAVVVLMTGVLAGSLQARSAGETLYLRSLDPLAAHGR